MGQIIFNGVTPEELIQQFEVMLDKKLKTSLQIPAKEEYLSRKEAAKLLRITLPTLHEWTRIELVQSQKIGGRVLYQRSELEKAVIENNIRKRKFYPK